MKAEEVRNLNWVKVENWEDISKSVYGKANRRFIGKHDVESFVENIFRDISRKLKIPAEELIPVLREENNAFYIILNKFYSKYEGLTIDAKEFKEIKALLRIPNIPFVRKDDITVITIIDECSKLSDEDKTKIINELNSEIGNDLRIDDQKVIEYFNSLPDIEKFNVMKYLGAFEVKVEIIPK